ncbi:MAG: hypothetical protein QG626_138 [Patescibacteria group bacterium]|nr:hypothetical protein [Patescibacteria group bacterium]
MVERGPAYKPRLDRESGQLQRNNPEIVKVERTPENFEQNPFEINLKGEALEKALEGRTYSVGQQVELLNAAGIPEPHTLIGIEETNKSIFLIKTGDTSPAASLEILTPTELAIEEAVQPLAEAAAKHWDKAVERLAYAPHSDLSTEEAHVYFAENKGKILRAAALSAFEKSIEQTRDMNDALLEAELKNAISFYIRQKMLEYLDVNPRHREAENLRARSEYFYAIGNERSKDYEPTVSTPITELIRSKIDLLKFSSEPEITVINPRLWAPIHDGEVFDPDLELGELTTIDSNSYKQQQALIKAERLKSGAKSRGANTSLSVPRRETLPTYAATKERSKEAWAHLRNAAQSAEKYLTLEDPSSLKILEVYKTLETAYADACRLDRDLHTARLREHVNEESEVSDAEFSYWEKYLTGLENKPIIATEKRARTIRSEHKRQVPQTSQKIPDFTAHQPVTQPTIKQSWAGKQIDRLLNWFSL